VLARWPPLASQRAVGVCLTRWECPTNSRWVGRRCALGDLTKDDAHYVTAWERSKGRHVRAKRSLARTAAARDDFAAAAVRLLLSPLRRLPGVVLSS
jgi:hypothetical protein